MKWSEVTSEHNGKMAEVWAESTPSSPETGEGPYFGRIYCPKHGVLPVLHIGDYMHYFSGYYNVEFNERRDNGKAEHSQWARRKVSKTVSGELSERNTDAMVGSRNPPMDQGRRIMSFSFSDLCQAVTAVCAVLITFKVW